MARNDLQTLSLAEEIFPIHNKVDADPYADILGAVGHERFERTKNKSLGLILLECQFATFNLTVEGNKLVLTLKRECQERMNRIIDKKIDSYNQIVKNIVLPILEGVFELGGLGTPGLQAFCRSWNVGVRAAENQLGNAHQAELTAFDHLVKQLDGSIDQYTKGKQDYQQTLETINRIIDQYMQQLQENFRAVAG